jgi:RecA-family ATPase
MFKVFPCGANKHPLINDWQAKASNDPAQIKAWQDQFGQHLAYWGLPTGSMNNIIALDVDVKKANGFETLKQFPLPPTMSQTTPSKGAHYVFQYPNGGFTYGNRVNMYPGIDRRGEGGYICVYGFDNTPIGKVPDWFIEDVVKGPTYLKGPTITTSPQVAAPQLEAILATIRDAAQGERNHTLNSAAFKVGQLIASGGVSKEYAESALYHEAVKIGLHPREIQATLNSGIKGGHEKPIVSPFGVPDATGLPKIEIVKPWKPEPFSALDLFNTAHLKKPQLFKDWSTQDIHITTADGGTGKTTLKLYEAICLALGERFLGFDCMGEGKTLFITGEDSAPKIAAMIGAIAKQMGVLDDSVRLNKVLTNILVKKDTDLCLIIKDKQGFLHPNLQAMDQIIETIHEFKPNMIVFDPISSFWGSEAALNDMAKAVSKFMMRLLEESNACIEMVNHMGKQSSSTKDMTQFAGRGGTGLPSHARVSRVLRVVGEDEYLELTGKVLPDNQSAIMCNVAKFTDGSPLINTPFLIIREGYLFTRESIDKPKVREDRNLMGDMERVFKYISQCRAESRYPTKSIVIAHFATDKDKLSKAKVEHALAILGFNGYEGKKVAQVQGPDATVKEQVYVLTDMNGKEL